ncbi:MAG: Lrp/AsnC family transcriptional regulator [Polyangiaceae bacterium]|nr:Lrp/AsnC family transcriptional regulator [Polyangiaceae bacterium]MBK8937185.1 Lrp/AsnC family transcriptional regulator [Polyangiaceae bacterium]
MAETIATETLDAIDRKILSLLQDNGRMTNAALAEAVGLTPTPMLQRIRKLEQSGVITGYMAMVDPSKVGRAVLAFIHVTLRSHGVPVHQRFLELVARLPEVLECHHIAGEEDFLLKIAVRDIAEVETFLLRRLGATDVIGRVKTTFVLSTSKRTGPLVPAGAEEATP